MDYCNIIKGTLNSLHKEALPTRGKESCHIDLYQFKYSKGYACSWVKEKSEIKIFLVFHLEKLKQHLALS